LARGGAVGSAIAARRVSKSSRAASPRREDGALHYWPPYWLVARDVV
jgi:hypothetical protein